MGRTRIGLIKKTLMQKRQTATQKEPSRKGSDKYDEKNQTETPGHEQDSFSSLYLYTKSLGSSSRKGISGVKQRTIRQKQPKAEI